MGGIITSSHDQSPSPCSPSTNSSYPKYYNPDLTMKEIELCSQFWLHMIDDTTPSPTSDDRLRDWFYMKLYNSINNDAEIPKIIDCHIFIRSFLQLIPISFRQFQTSSHFLEHFHHFGKKCSQVGITSFYLNKFGSYLFSIILQINNDIKIHNAWIIIPYVVGKGDDLTVPSDYQLYDASDPSISLTLNPHGCPFLYIEGSPSSNVESNRRFYTAMENIIL